MSDGVRFSASGSQPPLPEWADITKVWAVADQLAEALEQSPFTPRLAFKAKADAALIAYRKLKALA